MSSRLLFAFFVLLSLVVFSIPVIAGLFDGLFQSQPNFLILDDTKDHNLNDLNDVTISTPLNNQAIIFNSTTLQWENKAQAGGGGGGRTYAGIAPISVNNDTNDIGLNILATSDWNGLFDGNTSLYYVNWQNHINRLFSLITLDDNSSFDARYVEKDPTAGQVISGNTDLNHLVGHTFLGHTILLGSSDDELLLLQAFAGQTEHIFSIQTAEGAHIFTILPSGETDLNFLATEDVGHALHIDVEADGFANITGLEFDFVTGALGIESEVQVILIEVDQFEAGFGQVDGIQMVATSGDANLHFAEIGILIDPITQLSGIFGDMDSAFVAGVDQLSAFTSFDSNVAMFVNDDDNVLIGNSVKFAEIEFILDTESSGAGIKPVFEHSTGVGTFSTFFPTDTTEGMRSNGVIVYDLELIPDWEVGANNEFLIRITRTRNSLTTVPIEALVQITDAIEYFWNAQGSIFIKDLNASFLFIDGNASIVYDVNARQFCLSDDCINAWADVNGVGAVSGIFAGGNIDINSTIGDILISLNDGNLFSFDQLVTGAWTFADDITFSASKSILTSGTFDISINPNRFLNLGTAQADEVRLGRTAGTIPVIIQGGTDLRFRDSDITIDSPVDGQLDINADSRIQITGGEVSVGGDDFNVLSNAQFDMNLYVDVNQRVNFRDEDDSIKSCFYFDGNIFVIKGSGGC